MKFIDVSSNVLELVSEPENKLILLVTVDFAAFIEKAYLREGRMSLKFLEEDLRLEPIVISLKKFLPFLEEIKNQFQLLFEAGYKEGGDNINSKDFQRYHENIDAAVPPLVLNMDDLGIGFVVCLIPLALSVVVFVCELAVPRIKAFSVKTRDLLVYLYLIRALSN